MLSILIPIYNIDCRDLVGNLDSQCREFGIEFEVICFDDASEMMFKTLNSRLKALKNVKYVELEKNAGRAVIRNMLAKEAKYDLLLFIDSDSLLVRDDFIKKYASYARQESAIYGGTIYQDKKPLDKTRVLHWKYARKYEALPPEERVNKPFISFMSNNFLIRKELFEKVWFDAGHKGYGYEDTLFALQLEKMGARICHIDNPVLHSGLIKSSVFLDRTSEAMRNLVNLYQSGQISDTSLIRFYHRLKRVRIDGLTAFVIGYLMSLFRNNLKSGSPYILFFQLYKYYKFYKYIHLLRK